MKFTKFFTELNKKDAGIAGGKGASLGEMTQAGIPVPPGFVVLADTFEKFLHATDLIQEVDAILDTVDHKEIHLVDAASEKIQGLIKNAKTPEDIKAAIMKDFDELNTEFVAVRSSATAEDGQDHAWAGQLDSYLNITRDNVLEKVQHCWASLFTPRAIFYRFEKGLHSTKISVAVVVQKMVNSEVSGIAFSVHPVTEDRNQLIIEAGFGLGEAIVSGQITPDSYVVEKNPRGILDINVSEQSRGLFRKEGGNNEWKELGEQGKTQVLDEKQIHELSNIILNIENHYGFPCDIEWAFEANKFYIVQSRPITTLQKINNDTDSKKVGYISPELEGFNPDEYYFQGLWKNDLFATCFWQDCWVPELLKDLKLDMDKVGVMNLKGGHYLVSKLTKERIDKQIEKLIDAKNEKFFKNMVKVADKTFAWGEKEGDLLHSKKPTLENFREFVATAKKLNFLWLIGATYINWSVEERLLDAVVKEKFPAEHVLDLIPKIVTPLHHYQHGVKELKNKIGNKTYAEVEKDHKLFDQLKKHAEKYAWVEIFNFIGEPMTPSRLFDQIQHLKTENAEHKPFVSSKPLSKEILFLAECMHDVGYIKQGAAEYFSIFSEKVAPFLRGVAKEVGVTYREFMCLLTSEIDLALQGKLSAKELKERADKRIGVNDWTVIGGKGGEMIFVDEVADIKLLMEQMIPKTGDDATELIGQTGNRGNYTGPVRVVMNTYDFGKVQPGDVLVTTMTTPDFIILMQKSGAIITDIGGLLCHAAIVSRELHKPCVIGTKFATQVLKDGDMVEVDADKGVVRIVK